MFIRWPSHDFSETLARLENCHFIRPLINSRRPLCANWSCNFTPQIFMIMQSGVRIMRSLGREGSILGSSTRDAAPLLSKSCARFRTPRPRRSSEAITSVPLRRTNSVFVLFSVRPTRVRPDTARMSSNHYDANGSAAFTQQQLTQKIGPYGAGDNCLLLRVNVLEHDRANLPDLHGTKDCKIRQHRHRNATQIFVPKMGLQALNLRHSRD